MEPLPKHTVSTKRKIFRWAIMTTLVYCSVGLVLFYLQKKILFHPTPLARDYEFKFPVPFEEINIPMNATDTLNIIRFFPAIPAPKGVVLYFHGNRENVNRYAKYAANFTKNGYEVWMPDYPGFGKTTGELTEKNMYLQAKEVYTLAHSKFPAAPIFVYGKSLGTGLASYIAAKKDVKGVILETPYYSIPDLFSSYAPIYPTGRMSLFKFPVAAYLKETRAPVTIFHGTADRVIFFSHAEKLKKVLKPADEFITIENGTHHNLNDFPVFHHKLDSILNQ